MAEMEGLSGLRAAGLDGGGRCVGEGGCCSGWLVIPVVTSMSVLSSDSAFGVVPLPVPGGEGMFGGDNDLDGSCLGLTIHQAFTLFSNLVMMSPL